MCLNNNFFFLFTFLAVKHKLIHRPSLFLLNINDISRRKDSDFLFYGDELCHIIHYKKFDKTDIQLNEYFSNLCDWFTYNELSIHFGEDGNKYMLFGSKRKLKTDYLTMTYTQNVMNQYSMSPYFDCFMDENMFQDATTRK